MPEHPTDAHFLFTFVFKQALNPERDNSQWCKLPSWGLHHCFFMTLLGATPFQRLFNAAKTIFKRFNQILQGKHLYVYVFFVYICKYNILTPITNFY